MAVVKRISQFRQWKGEKKAVEDARRALVSGLGSRGRERMHQIMDCPYCPGLMKLEMGFMPEAVTRAGRR